MSRASKSNKSCKTRRVRDHKMCSNVVKVEVVNVPPQFIKTILWLHVGFVVIGITSLFF
ncbi:hypothetical protein PQC38_gp011 [Aeromonas phage BUCT695]|uniref:hypothetical protein n=1 Tax=Aeromonas phage BUCT695 TaxID=2908630 RepID=UPI0023297652|nr:hypothetical protein PQC38_gp011 [Aeromonas phage BUCT695]UIW10487.1 hypothetical protein [Aeromonas phage BUCT695]